MKRFTRQAAQGDTLYTRIDTIPEDALLEDSKGGPVIVAHSETGHDHVFPDGSGVKLYRTKDPFVCYLRCETESMLEHMRDFDTHETILFSPGLYEARRQREHAPEGYRMVQD
jgi:hypothetical protein